MVTPAHAEDIEPMLENILETADPARRISALNRLVPIAGRRLLPVIRQMIESSDIEERIAAIRAAEGTECYELEERILRETASEDAGIACAAARAASVLSDLRARGALRLMLQGLGTDLEL